MHLFHFQYPQAPSSLLLSSFPSTLSQLEVGSLENHHLLLAIALRYWWGLCSGYKPSCMLKLSSKHLKILLAANCSHIWHILHEGRVALLVAIFNSIVCSTISTTNGPPTHMISTFDPSKSLLCIIAPLPSFILSSFFQIFGYKIPLFFIIYSFFFLFSLFFTLIISSIVIISLSIMSCIYLLKHSQRLFKSMSHLIKVASSALVQLAQSLSSWLSHFLAYGISFSSVSNQ